MHPSPHRFTIAAVAMIASIAIAAASMASASTTGNHRQAKYRHNATQHAHRGNGVPEHNLASRLSWGDVYAAP